MISATSQTRILSNKERLLLAELKRRGLSKTDCEVPPAWFHSYQREAWNSAHDIVAICAGWQSGKTVFLPPWLKREIQRKGPGDYGAFSSTYKLLSRKFLPELRKEFCEIAEYRKADMQFVLTEEGSRSLWGAEWKGEPTVIQLGYAENPDSLESATMKAVAWDEPGQRLVPEQSFLTVQSRLMVNRGRMALASRPYESGWYERLVKSAVSNAKIKVVCFPSWANPVNPQVDDSYWEELRASMPAWKFAILYEGRFEKPAGLIYDTFDWESDTCEDFDVSRLNVHPGMDFGGVHVSGVAASDDGENIYIIGDYLSVQKKPYDDHIKEMNALTSPSANGKRYVPGAGGSRNGEEGWREACRMHGLPLDAPPVQDVEVQIQCVYEMLATKRLKFFRRGAAKTIDEIQMYSRELDEENEPTEKIADKSKFHRLDALRYIVSKLRPPKAKSTGYGSGIKVITELPASTAYVPR